MEKLSRMLAPIGPRSIAHLEDAPPLLLRCSLAPLPSHRLMLVGVGSELHMEVLRHLRPMLIEVVRRLS